LPNDNPVRVAVVHYSAPASEGRCPGAVRDLSELRSLLDAFTEGKKTHSAVRKCSK